MVMRFGPEYLTYVKRCGYDTLTLVVAFEPVTKGQNIIYIL